MSDIPARIDSKVPEFRMQNNFTISDILSVAVGEAESKLQTTLKDKMSLHKNIETKIKRIAKEIEKEIDNLRVACGLQGEIDSVNKILGGLFKSTISCTSDVDRERKSVAFNICMGHNSSTRLVPYSVELTRVFGLLEAERESLIQIQAEVAEVRKGLANIPALERRYRGKLVASQLEQTVEGKNVLGIIMANMEEELRNI